MIKDFDKNNIEDFVILSKIIGERKDFVQGGGGNTSFKINENIMAIKASGYFLKDLTSDNGFTFVNYAAIKNYIKNINLSQIAESDLTQFFQENVVKLDQYKIFKPSIETGFHAILSQKYVVHTHSVYANIICCCVEGRDIAKALFPEALWVEYKNPGKEITFAIYDLVKIKSANIIFMQNHGIIICAESAKDAHNLHNFVNQKIIEYFKINKDYDSIVFDISIKDIDNKVIFPDQVVYLSSQDLSISKVGIETLYAYKYIMQKIYALKLSPNFITQKDINYIENMESEKYRKSLIKK